MNPTPFMALKHTLNVHTNAVGALAISPDGRTLLSGGDDSRVVVWNLDTGELKQQFFCRYNGFVSSVAWINTDKQNDGGFVFGCADGTLHIYHQDKKTGLFAFNTLINAHDEMVDDLAFDSHHRRIASVGSGRPHVWRKAEGEWQSLAPVVLEKKPYQIRNVHFCDDGASILVYYCESHQIACYSIEPWSVKWVKEVPTRIGNAVFCPDSKYIFVSNLVDGVDQYSFPTLERVQTFPHDIVNNFTMQVGTLQQAAFVVAGSDNGFARVFERRSGQVLVHLKHGNKGDLVQTVATHWNAKGSRVATGSSTINRLGTIKVWVNSCPPERTDKYKITASSNILSLVQVLLIIVLTSAVVTAAHYYLAQPHTATFHILRHLETNDEVTAGSPISNALDILDASQWAVQHSRIVNPIDKKIKELVATARELMQTHHPDQAVIVGLHDSEPALAASGL